MINEIRQQAALIQDGLWEIAKRRFGLDRTQENVDRMQKAFADIACSEMDASEWMEAHRGIDVGLAAAFFAVSYAESETDLSTALEILVVAAEAKGALTNEPAVELARKRHAEHQAMIEYAIKYWRANIDPKLSAQKAANELLNVVNLGHKKLAEIVSKAKRGEA
ncbi:hypothetical protein AZSI13_31370 [Azospira sp. I13]|uniref:hypothetical protein n=1 Tax=Azospira sp. I13 TaxID=1765050 RepID=UPI000D4D558C|nr:hypothetical protein [Azospira sp. I13]GBG03810.1 hypothetical protein AZSI13_31370 [Azospira sp. I13]